MLERTQNSDPLLRHFHAFYVELTRLRRMAEGRPAEEKTGVAPPLLLDGRGSSGQDEHGSSSGRSLSEARQEARQEKDRSDLVPAEEVDPLVLRVWQEMAQYLDQILYEAKTSVNQLSRDLMEELVYILASFADETFLCLLDWPGRSYWRNHLMEMRLFGSRISGQLIFGRIDNLLSRQDFGADEICAVYLTILALGFRGRYLRDPEAVNSYRQRLFDRLLLNHPDLHSENLRLIPEAYRHTVVEGAPVHLPEPRTWWLVVAGLIGSWLVLSTIAWLMLTIPVRVALERTMHSLDRIKERHTVSQNVTRWQSLALMLQDGAFRIEIHSPVPLQNASVGGNLGKSVAPLLIAVAGEGGSSPGKVTDVQAWLARGSIEFQAVDSGMALKSRPLESVELWHAPGGVLADSGSSQFFLVSPQLDAAELGLRPQLIFPVDEKGPAQVASVTLYLPRQAAAVRQ
jgi:type IV/VI secretion system ImpK/VasF family protein